MKNIVVNYNLGNACNLRCKFCYNDSGRENKQYYKDIEEIKREFKKLILSSNGIVFIGGEPLYHPKILEIIKLSREIGFVKVGIVTNGVRFSDIKFTEKILFLGISNIIFSIHSHNEKLETKIVDRKGVFEKKIAGINNLREIEKKINIKINKELNIVINKYNINYINDILDFFNNLGFKYIGLYTMLLYAGETDKNISILPKYSDLENSLLNLSFKYSLWIHWAPLCISIKFSNFIFIREISKKYIYNIKNNGGKLFDNQSKFKLKLKECNNCFAYGKFCFGVYKKYIEKYGEKEFKAISKIEIKYIIKKQILKEKNNINKK